MYKICIDDDLKDVAGGLHTPFGNDQTDEKNSAKEDGKEITDEEN